MSRTKNVLKVSNSAELLSYIINVTPELKDEIDLPVQGESILPIGRLIINNERYKNAFINTVNLIGLTVIKRNGWDNPWTFTKRGTLRFGQQVREIINDLADVFDYNTYATDVDKFLDNSVPNIYNYIHEINFQKWYRTTTSDEQMAMAFESEDSLFRFIDETIGMLYQSLMYDEFLVDKYMLCRRVLDGTVTSVYIPNFDSITARQRVAVMKAVSNKMTFRSPNYNPAGIRRATRFEDQIMILNCEYDAQVTTEVLATSFFRNDAEFKVQAKLIDSFSETDDARLTELLGSAYIPFTNTEKSQLATIPAVLLSREWFMDYDYAMNNESGDMKYTEFYNPTTLKNNHFLHYWGVKSTSPFENAVVFTTVEPTVTSVTISPSSASVSVGSELQLKASVTTTGFANKAVQWTVDSTSKADGVTITTDGLLKVPSDASVESITVTATSVYDTSVSGTASITVASATLPSITSVTVSAAGSATSVAKGATLQLSATVVRTGNASQVVTWSVDSDSATDGVTISSTGLLTVPENATVESITATATSVFDDTKDDDIILTVTSG